VSNPNLFQVHTLDFSNNPLLRRIYFDDPEVDRDVSVWDSETLALMCKLFYAPHIRNLEAVTWDERVVVLVSRKSEVDGMVKYKVTQREWFWMDEPMWAYSRGLMDGPTSAYELSSFQRERWRSEVEEHGST
jgi:hypothetical protein